MTTENQAWLAALSHADTYNFQNEYEAAIAKEYFSKGYKAAEVTNEEIRRQLGHFLNSNGNGGCER